MKTKQPCEFSRRIIRWTQEAMNCYMRGCICKNCPIYKFYFKGSKNKCQMKTIVIESVRKLKLPNELKRKNQIIED